MPDGPHTVAAYEIEDVPVPAASHKQLQLVPAASTGELQPVSVRAVSGRPFKPGQSGNPAGRKPGSKNRLSELFIEAMRSDFAEHGAAAIAQLRERDPGTYLSAVRSMIPNHIMVENADKLPTVDDALLSDDEFAATIDGEGNPLEHAARQARRNRAFELFASGRFATMREALISLGAAIP